MKFFLSLSATIETNGYLAYSYKTFCDEDPDITRAEWKALLADQLIKYGQSMMSPGNSMSMCSRRSSRASNKSPTSQQTQASSSSDCILPAHLYSVTHEVQEK